MHIIQDFSLWKAVNEDELPSKEKEKDSSKNNKAVIIPIDNNTFKIKLVNNDQVVINGKLTPSGFANLLTFIKGQRTIIDYYKDLKTLYTVDSNNQAVLVAASPNLVIYSIAKDNNRKEVIIFKIVSKTELLQKDPSKHRIPDNILFLKDDEVGGVAAKSSIVSGDTGENSKEVKTNTGKTAGLTLPVKGASINGSTSAPLIEFITKAYRAVAAKLTGNPILPKVKEEVRANLLGVSSQTFVKALNSGFGIKDSQFGEDVEEDVTNTLVGKLDKPDELNVTLFGNVAAPTAKVDTGDIIVPADGFRGGMQRNAELKKFQELLKTKLAVKLKDHKTYQEFVKAGGKKGFVGNYGPLTANLITLLKSISKPSYPNQNGNVIEPQLVSMVRAINESSMYLALDGFTLITEEDSFDFTAAPNYSPTVSDSGEVESSSNGVVRKKVASSYVAKPADLKSVKNFQQYVIKQSGSGWSSGMDDGKWGPKTSAAWTKYGKAFMDSGQNVAVSTTTEGKIDDLFKEVLQGIYVFMKDDSNFKTYKDKSWHGMGSDKAGEAWKNSIKVKWKKVWSLSLEKAKPLIDTLKSADDKKKAQNNHDRIVNMFGKTGEGSFYNAIINTKDDIWTFSLPLLLGGTKTYDMRTDF